MFMVPPQILDILSSCRYTLSDLMNRIQCSEEELDKALRDIEAYHIYGKTYFHCISPVICLAARNSVLNRMHLVS